MAVMIFGLEGTGLVIAAGIVLFFGVLGPFLYQEIRRGKAKLGRQVTKTSHGIKLGPVTPIGAGDNHPGTVGNPAPGQPDGQANPYGPRAQRGADAPIKS